jgi:two-component system, cell cycle response regulator DivK
MSTIRPMKPVEPPAQERSMPSNLVLVIEDDAINLKLFVLYLSAKGLRVVTATSTREAEQAIAAEPPGLILVDLSLPSEDGLSWVARARKAGLAAGIPIIAVTAHAMPSDRRRALASGCNGFVTKPIDFKALVQLAQKHLGLESA